MIYSSCRGLLVGILGALAPTFGAPLQATAQSDGPPARVVGAVFDSTRGAPLAGARVFVSGSADAAISDSSGRFSLSTRRLGPRTISFRHRRLDSLGTAAPGYAVVLSAGETAAVRMSVPSRRSIGTALCGPDGGGVAIVHGSVRDTARRQGLGDVVLTLRPVKRGSGNRSAQDGGGAGSVAQALSDARGDYRICGAPPDAVLALRAVDGERLLDLDTLRLSADAIVRRDLAFGTPGPVPAAPAPVVAALTEDPGAPPATPPADASLVDALPRPGPRPVVAGTVVDAFGRPVPLAEVVDSAGGRAIRADSLGRFALAFPGTGSYALEVRRLGYRSERISLSTDAVRPAVVVLQRSADVLDEVTVTGRADPVGFHARKARGAGHFLTGDQVRRRGPLDLADVFRGIPGVRLERVRSRLRDSEFVPQFDRGVAPGGGNCPVTYYVDGTPVSMGWEAVSWQVRPADIEGIEIYQGAQVPPQFLGRTARCGVVVIWTRRSAAPSDSTARDR